MALMKANVVMAVMETSMVMMETNVVRGYCDRRCESVSPPRGRDVSLNGGSRHTPSDSSNAYNSLQLQLSHPTICLHYTLAQ